VRSASDAKTTTDGDAGGQRLILDLFGPFQVIIRFNPETSIAQGVRSSLLIDALPQVFRS